LGRDGVEADHLSIQMTADGLGDPIDLAEGASLGRPVVADPFVVGAVDAAVPGLLVDHEDEPVADDDEVDLAGRRPAQRDDLVRDHHPAIWQPHQDFGRPALTFRDERIAGVEEFGHA